MLGSQLRAFLEVLLITICLQTYRLQKQAGVEQALMVIFDPICEKPLAARALRQLFEADLRRTDVVSTTTERTRLLRCCDIVQRLLQQQDDFT